MDHQQISHGPKSSGIFTKSKKPSFLMMQRNLLNQIATIESLAEQGKNLNNKNKRNLYIHNLLPHKRI